MGINGGGGVEVEEILQWLVLFGLDTFWHFLVLLSVEEEVVGSWDSDSVSILILFINPLAHSS